MTGFNDIMATICQLLSERIGEDVEPGQAGYESIRLSSDEIGYPGITGILPAEVLVHMFIYEEWSGYAVVDLEQSNWYAIGVFYGADY